jgi:Uncharacterised protein family UPF0047
MPAHIRTVPTGVQLAVPILRGELALGTWQGIYLFEHRRAPHRRERLAPHWRMPPAAQITDRKRGWASQFSLIYETRVR